MNKRELKFLTEKEIQVLEGLGFKPSEDSNIALIGTASYMYTDTIGKDMEIQGARPTYTLDDLQNFLPDTHGNFRLCIYRTGSDWTYSYISGTGECEFQTTGPINIKEAYKTILFIYENKTKES